MKLGLDFTAVPGYVIVTGLPWMDNYRCPVCGGKQNEIDDMLASTKIVRLHHELFPAPLDSDNKFVYKKRQWTPMLLPCGHGFHLTKSNLPGSDGPCRNGGALIIKYQQ